MKSLTKIAAAVALAGAFVAPAVADPFYCLTNNSGSCSTLATNFSWTFDDTLDRLTISNNGVTVQPFIGNIYFDYGAGMDVTSVFAKSAGVNGTLTPGGNLPSGNNALPVFNADEYYDMASPASTNGANGGEFITFQLSSVSAANFASGAFRVGLHVQGAGAGNQFSEAMVNVPAIPEPETYALMLAGLAAVGFMARRRRQA